MVSVDTLVVFGLIAVALGFFITETLPTDITAISVLVSLVVLEPYTGVDTAAALQGFASAIVESATLLPLFAVVVVVYLLTGLLANLITPVASVVLLLPVAVDAAARIGASRYAFLLATMFAARRPS